jgi:hypothetical protein
VEGGGEGEFSLSLSLSLLGFPPPIPKEEPIQPQIGPGSAFIMSRGGSGPPCRRYQRGEGEGPLSPFPLWFTRQGGGSIPPSRHLQKVLCEGGMGGLRCGDGGS